MPGQRPSTPDLQSNRIYDPRACNNANQRNLTSTTPADPTASTSTRSVGCATGQSQPPIDGECGVEVDVGPGLLGR